MRPYEKIAIHTLFYAVFAALFLNLVLLFGHTIQGWHLPLTYVLYTGGLLLFHKLRHLPITKIHMGLAVALPLFLLLAAQVINYTYDTTWDGQDYQQSGVIALAQGWNPWHNGPLPIDAATGEAYVLGYPKTTWLLQSGIYALTGHLQMATITSFIAAATAGALVYGALRRLGLEKAWSAVITVLAVTQIHFMQQMFTFMNDGYSYQLSLAAIALFILLVKEKNKTWPLLGLLCTWLLLAGAKFSNLLICAILGILSLVYLYRVKAHQQPLTRKVFAGFVAVAAIMLWVPYGTNLAAHGSPVYPQNQATERSKLRYDNVPLNLKEKDRASLLFYGIFSAAEPREAGYALSPLNVAHLKVPFTFQTHEHNPQGRVGAGGILFSGIVLLALVFYVLLAIFRPAFRSPGMLKGVAIGSGLIVMAALITPVPNMLRYTPLLTLIPLLVLVLLTAVKGKKAWWIKTGIALLAVCIAINAAVTLRSVLMSRVSDIHIVTSQLASMKQTGQMYHVDAQHFHANYLRLEEYGVPFVIDRQLRCARPEPLVFTYDTTLFCGYPKQ